MSAMADSLRSQIQNFDNTASMLAKLSKDQASFLDKLDKTHSLQTVRQNVQTQAQEQAASNIQAMLKAHESTAEIEIRRNLGELRRLRAAIEVCNPSERDQVLSLARRLYSSFESAHQDVVALAINVHYEAQVLLADPRLERLVSPSSFSIFSKKGAPDDATSYLWNAAAVLKVYVPTAKYARKYFHDLKDSMWRLEALLAARKNDMKAIKEQASRLTKKSGLGSSYSQWLADFTAIRNSIEASWKHWDTVTTALTSQEILLSRFLGDVEDLAEREEQKYRVGLID